MVVQYPDKIIITRKSGGDSYQDKNLNWVINDVIEIIELDCRFVPNGSGKQIKLADGSDYTYGYRIAFPIGTTNIQVMDDYERVGTSYKGIIQQFEIGQLHSVAWV